MSCNLATGGFGFIGGYLAWHLLEKGEEVVKQIPLADITFNPDRDNII